VELKGYLYMACTVGTAVMSMNVARRGIPGPGTLFMLLLPLTGLVILLALDLVTYLKNQRSEAPRRRGKSRPGKFSDRIDDRW
jgi:hypothetical protein